MWRFYTDDSPGIKVTRIAFWPNDNNMWIMVRLAQCQFWSCPCSSSPASSCSTFGASTTGAVATIQKHHLIFLFPLWSSFSHGPPFQGLSCLWCQVINVCIFSTGEVFQDFKFGSLNQLIRTMEDCNRSSPKHDCVFCRHCSITMTTKF